MSPDPDTTIVLPGPDRRALVLLHGRGGTEGDLVAIARAVAPERFLVAPRGPEPEGAGWAWFRHHRIGVPVRESLDERLEEMAAWLDGELARLELTEPVTLVGFSNGGMMAGALLSARPGLVEGAALLAGADPFFDDAQLAAGAEAYRRAGAAVETVVDPEGGHGVTPRLAGALEAWLHTA
jgi:phospholipase/carboxylesterase